MSLPKLRSFVPVVAAAILSLAAACDRSTSPENGAGGRVIGVNQIVAGTVSARDTARYAVVVARGQRVALLLQAQSGEVSALMRAPGVISPESFLHLRADGRPLGAVSTEPFTAPQDDAYTITVWGDGAFRLQFYVADTGPELASRTVAIGDTVVRETLYAPADVDEFQLRGVRGDTVVILMQTTDPLVDGTARVAVLSADGKTLGGTSALHGRSLEQSASVPIALPSDGMYTVRVSGAPAYFTDVGYGGPYRLHVRRFNSAPEHASASVRAGVTLVNEAIDHAHDVDDYVIAGASGALYNVLVQAPAGDAEMQVRVEVEGGIGGSSISPLIVYSSGRDTLLTDRGTGRFALPPSGRVTVHVSGDVIGPTVVPYRLRVVPIDERPESMPIALALGDSVVGERIDEPGDVDEFTLDVATPTLMNLVLEIPPGRDNVTNGGDALGLQIVREGEAPSSPMAVWRTERNRDATSRFTMPAGHHRLRVAGLEGRVNAFYGAYRIYAYRIDTLPERVSPTLVLGDTISEAIDPPGDLDMYWYDGVRGEHVELVTIWPDALPGLGVPVGSTLVARGRRHTFAESGRYRIGFQGFGLTDGLLRGAYRMVLLRFPSTPETHRADIALGEVVTDEQLDVADDVDEFKVRGTPGSRAVARLTASEETSGAHVELVDPTTKRVLAEMPSYAGEESTPPAVFPASGALIVRVSDSLYESRHDSPILGRYRLEVVSGP